MSTETHWVITVLCILKTCLYVWFPRQNYLGWKSKFRTRELYSLQDFPVEWSIHLFMVLKARSSEIFCKNNFFIVSVEIFWSKFIVILLTLHSPIQNKIHDRVSCIFQAMLLMNSILTLFTYSYVITLQLQSATRIRT